MLQIAAIITLPFALISCAVFAFTGHLNFISLVCIWVQTYAMVYFAVWILSRRDHTRQSATIVRIRGEVLGCPELTDDEFLLQPFEQPQILIEIRRAVAQILDVPAVRISRSMPLFGDIRQSHLDQWFVFSLLKSLLEPRGLEDMAVRIPPTSVETIDDLAKWFNRTYLKRDGTHLQ